MHQVFKYRFIIRNEFHLLLDLVFINFKFLMNPK